MKSRVENGSRSLVAEPFTGKPLGSPQQSWTAAVTLDWSASSSPRAAPVCLG
jgi:glucosylglycerate hydrolase